MSKFAELRASIKARSKDSGKSVFRALLVLMAMITLMVVPVSADTISDNITTAFTYVTAVITGILNVLYVTFVTNLGTWVVLGVVGLIFLVIGGFGRFFVRFLFSFIGKMETRYTGKE